MDFVLNAGFLCMLQEADICRLCNTGCSVPLTCTVYGTCPGMQLWVPQRGEAPVPCPGSRAVGAGNDCPMSHPQGCPGRARAEKDPKCPACSSVRHPWVHSGASSPAPCRPLAPALGPAGRASRQDCGFWLSGISSIA